MPHPGQCYPQDRGLRTHYTQNGGASKAGLDAVKKRIATFSVGHQFEILCNEVHGEGIPLEKQAHLQLVKISLYFMEPECSGACSQELATSPYPDPVESNSCPPLLFFV